MLPIIEPPMGTGYAHRSVSQVSSIAQCGEAFRLSRVAQAPSRPAAWFGHGTAYHFAIEEWENSHRSLSEAATASLFTDMYRAEIAKLKERWPEEDDWLTGGRKKGFKDIEDREQIGLWQVKDYREFAEANKDVWRILPMGDGKLATEVKFEIWFGTVKVIGYIDQVREYRNGALEVADLKTGSRATEPMQLGVYRQVVAKETGVTPDTGVFVKAGRPATEKVAAKPTKDVPHSLEDWTPELLTSLFEDADRIDKLGIYLPNPQEGCERTCGVAEFCRIKGWSKGLFDTIRVRAPKEEVATCA